MRFRRIEDTFLAIAQSEDEAKQVEQLLVQLTDGTAPAPPPVPPPSAVEKEDILMLATADTPFSEQPNYWVSTMNTFGDGDRVPESGIHGPDQPNIGTLRYGKTEIAGKKGLVFAISNKDPNTSGSKRTELKGHELDPNQVYWTAFGLYVPKWENVPSNDVATCGFQLHSGGGTGLSPMVQLNSRRGQVLNFDARHSLSSTPTQGNSKSVRSDEIPIPFDRWSEVVLKIKLSNGKPTGGYVQAWMDGELKMDFQGAVGYDHQHKPYFKFGFYNWTSGLNTGRRIILRNPVVVIDPTGDKYKHADLVRLIA